MSLFYAGLAAIPFIVHPIDAVRIQMLEATSLSSLLNVLHPSTAEMNRARRRKHITVLDIADPFAYVKRFSRNIDC